ncbi:MAG: helix-turn-helix domain-containing protein [Bauldia sp.]
MKPGFPHATANCRQIADVLARIGDKWSVLVISKLCSGPVRFNELKRQIGNISQKMLSTTLRALERDGLVSRTIFPTVPPRVDYELTALGHDLLRSVQGLEGWARANMDKVYAARAKFDGAAEAA